MKLSHILLVAVAVVVTMASCNKSKSNVRLKNESDSVSYCLGVLVGQNIAGMEIPNVNADIMAKAIAEAITKKKGSIEPQDADKYLQGYMGKLSKVKAAQSLKEGTEFMAKNKSNKGVITTASGLQYEVIKEGNGAVPTAEDNVKVFYKGSFIDGKVFDSTSGSEPASFPVNRVVPGFTEALQLMKVGSKYKVYIPSQLGYGENVDPRRMKPNAVLIFEIELVSIDPKFTAPAATKKK